MSGVIIGIGIGFGLGLLAGVCITFIVLWKAERP